MTWSNGRDYVLAFRGNKVVQGGLQRLSRLQESYYRLPTNSHTIVVCQIRLFSFQTSSKDIPTDRELPTIGPQQKYGCVVKCLASILPTRPVPPRFLLGLAFRSQAQLLFMPRCKRRHGRLNFNPETEKSQGTTMTTVQQHTCRVESNVGTKHRWRQSSVEP